MFRNGQIKKIGLLIVGIAISMSMMTVAHAQDEATRDVTLRNVAVKTYYDDVSQATSIPNSDYTVSYTDSNGNSVKAYSGMTDDTGAIKAVTLSNIPSSVTVLRINYTLGSLDRGYVLRSTGRNYQFAFSKSIPASNMIDYSGNVKFGASGNDESYATNFIAARINNYYAQAVNKVTTAIVAAHTQLDDIPNFQNQPINIYYERGFYLDKGSAFYRNGHDNNGVPDIVLGDRPNLSQFTDHYLMHNVMHEWTHWNLSREVGLLGGSYTTHYTYNTNFYTSYKEGLALFAGEMFAYDNDLSSTDNQVQTDSVAGVNRLYGKSTNKTAQQTIYDLLDVDSTNEKEDFYITEHYLNRKDFTLEELNELNFGVIYAELMQSKSLSLSEFLQYVENKYAITDSEKADFNQVLSVNGLSATGNFTLDEAGNPLSTD